MAEKKWQVNLNLNQNELLNAVVHNLGSSPASAKEGQIWFNTADHFLYIWSNGVATKVGYLPPATTTTLGGVIVGSNLQVASDGTLSIYDASTDHKGVIEIATDTEASTGTSEVLAVNPKQLATKVTANNAITGATHTKITYDSKGLVTAGSDITLADVTDVTATYSEVNQLHESNISKSDLEKLHDVTASAAELNILDGATLDTTELNYLDGVTSSVQTQIDNKVTKNNDITASTTGKTVITYDAKGLVTGGSEIAIDSGSTNYLEFDTSNHTIKAKVDTTVTDGSSKLVTSGAVASAIASALVGGVIYQGSWDITSATDFSAITLPVKKGYLYYVTGTGPKTIGGIEWNSGDYLLINKDIAAGGTITGSDVEKIDNTEAADIVRLNATQTLTNKTIDADDNTIADLETDNFKSGVIQTSVRASASAADTSLATEKAVRTELDTKQDRDTDAVENNIAKFDSNGTTVDSGKAFTTTVGPASGTGAATDNQVATALAVRTAINNAISATKFTATNPALTATGGVCTWSITNTMNDADVICIVKEVATGEEVEVETTYSASTITVKMNSDANISAGTYKAVVLG